MVTLPLSALGLEDLWGIADCRRTEPVSFIEHLTTLQFIIYPYGTVLYTRLFFAEDACKLLHYIKHRCKYTRVLFIYKSLTLNSLVCNSLTYFSNPF